MNFSLNFYATLLCLVGVLLLGRIVISKSKSLSYYNIPEPVVGGIIVAIILFCLNKFGNISFGFDGSMKEPLLLAFYSSIGLSADFSSFKKGGKVFVRSDAGIVADSVPDKEFEECMNKARASLKALELASSGDNV